MISALLVHVLQLGRRHDPEPALRIGVCGSLAGRGGFFELPGTEELLALREAFLSLVLAPHDQAQVRRGSSSQKARLPGQRGAVLDPGTQPRGLGARDVRARDRAGVLGSGTAQSTPDRPGNLGLR